MCFKNLNRKWSRAFSTEGGVGVCPFLFSAPYSLWNTSEAEYLDSNSKSQHGRAVNTFQASLSYTVRPYLNEKTTQNTQMDQFQSSILWPRTPLPWLLGFSCPFGFLVTNSTFLLPLASTSPVSPGPDPALSSPPPLSP